MRARGVLYLPDLPGCGIKMLAVRLRGILLLIMPLLTSTVHVILFWPGRLAPASFLGTFGKGVLDGEVFGFDLLSARS
jgi:hypothetical protein